MAFQDSYTVNPPVGMLGELARPNAPHDIIRGVFKHVTGGQSRLARPGDSVFWSTSADGWVLPNTAAESLTVGGIVTFTQARGCEHELDSRVRRRRRDRDRHRRGVRSPGEVGHRAASVGRMGSVDLRLGDEGGSGGRHGSPDPSH